MTRYLRALGKAKILERMSESGDGKDILSSIVNSSKLETVDLETMVDNFITFFIAGQETTANALAFTFLELGRNKRVLDKFFYRTY